MYTLELQAAILICRVQAHCSLFSSGECLSVVKSSGEAGESEFGRENSQSKDLCNFSRRHVKSSRGKYIVYELAN